MGPRLVGFVLGAAVLLTTGSAAMAPGRAAADSTCYTGCATPSIPSPRQPGARSGQQQAPTSDPSQSAQPGLPFTGADVAEVASGGLIALGAGTLLTIRNRQRSREEMPRSKL